MLAFHRIAQSPAHGLAQLFIELVQGNISGEVFAIQARQISFNKAIAALFAQHAQRHQLIALLRQNLAYRGGQFLQFWRHLHPVR